jgi:hypothetical protein
VLRKTEQREQGSIKVEEIASALHSYQWACTHILFFFLRQDIAVLPRLTLNYWAQAVLLLQPPRQIAGNYRCKPPYLVTSLLGTLQFVPQDQHNLDTKT